MSARPVASRVARSVRPTTAEHRVTPLELLFDLVFVFAFTQVTTLVTNDLSARGAIRGVVLFALLWFAWCSYAWLGNQARADEGLVRATVITAMAAMFVVALAIPQAWDTTPGGLRGPLLLAGALAVVRLLHLAVYAVAAQGDRALLRQLAIVAVPVVGSLALLVLGAVVGGPGQTAWWVAAVAVDYVGVYVTSVAAGWRLRSPAHFAERHGLIVIVALGESIVAIGAGIARTPLTWAVLAAAVLGIAVSVALWWMYFDVVALVAERVLGRREGAARSHLARDSYTYLHFPMVGGILVGALGLKKVLASVADGAEHGASAPLHGVPLWALAVGPACYLVALSLLRLRNVGRPNVGRLVVAALLLAEVAPASHLPALAALGLVTATLVGLVAVEAWRHAADRDAVRHRRATLTPTTTRAP